MQTLTRQFQAAFDRSDRLVRQCEAFFEVRGVWGRDAEDMRPRLTVKAWTDWTGCVDRVEFAGLRAVSDDALRAVLLARPVEAGLPDRARHEPVWIGLRLVGAGWSPG
ncbi:hypothetical protein [Paraburkholderia sp. BCC1885]|uniref:hypothetical protein n=1 Tax=Paraburkholderia sp. BCC1885 TaxID=2562669 RepID=UPI001182700B|nr:hypothetical protein [Paraburkholderia sp. BCC1885]